MSAKNSTEVGLNTQPLMDHLDALHDAINYRVVSLPGLAIGSTSAAKVKITNATQIIVNGVGATVSAAEVAFTATTHDITADASAVQEAVYLLSADSAGTVTITKGTTASGAGKALIPATPAGETAIGYVRIAVEVGATDFDATTDLLSASHLTDTYVDLGGNVEGLKRFDSAWSPGGVTAS